MLVLVATPGLPELADGLIALDAEGKPGLHLALKAPLAVGELFDLVLICAEGVEAGLIGACDQHHIFF